MSNTDPSSQPGGNDLFSDKADASRSYWLLDISKYVAIIVAVVFGFVLCLWGPTFYFWVLAPHEQYRVLVPEGYEGPVLIAWQIPNGEVVEKEGDSYIYKLGADGALLLQDDTPRTAMDMSFWYIEANESLVAIPFNSCFEDSVATQAVVCTGGTTVIYKTKELYPNQSFHITSTPKRSKWSTTENSTRLLDRYFGQLVIDSN